MDATLLLDFIRESNRIENIHRPPLTSEIVAHRAFIDHREITVAIISGFVGVVANARLRGERGMDVRVGQHFPPPGGPDIEARLTYILADAHTGESPYEVHRAYETLHPFMDGNGRSGRVLWLWQMLREGQNVSLGFLHRWYYDSLEAGR